MIRYMILVLMLSLAIPVDARLLEPEEYGDDQCGLIAKEYQDVYGGHIIFIQPLKPNGAHDLGMYRGHFINKAWNKKIGIYYIDYNLGICPLPAISFSCPDNMVLLIFTYILKEDSHYI